MVDRCTGCSLTDLDFSPHAFKELAGTLSVGRINGVTWAWDEFYPVATATPAKPVIRNSSSKGFSTAIHNPNDPKYSNERRPITDGM